MNGRKKKVLPTYEIHKNRNSINLAWKMDALPLTNIPTKCMIFGTLWLPAFIAAHDIITETTCAHCEIILDVRAQNKKA